MSRQIGRNIGRRFDGFAYLAQIETVLDDGTMEESGFVGDAENPVFVLYETYAIT